MTKCRESNRDRIVHDAGVLLVIMFRVIALSVILQSAADVRESRADGAAGSSFGASHGICNSFNPESGRWGSITAAISRPVDLCPRGFALVSSTPEREFGRDGSQINVTGLCCELPSDALTDEHSWQSELCPGDSVATGIRLVQSDSEPDEDFQVKELRCTRINRTRYQLGLPVAGVLVGNISNYPESVISTLGIRSVRQIAPSNVPPALRVGLGRVAFSLWQTESCVGLPWGSVVIGKHGNDCRNFTFRTLQYRNAEGGAPAGLAVPIIATCDAVDNPFIPYPRCLSFHGNGSLAEKSPTPGK